jgi:hypothetical protein
MVATPPTGRRAINGMTVQPEDRAVASQRLSVHLNEGTLLGLPAWSSVPRNSSQDVDFEQIRREGFCGLQSYAPNDRAIEAGLLSSGMARIVDASSCDDVVCQHKAWDFEVSTVHLGTGFESDTESYRLVEALLKAAAKHDHPVYVETHRATITQDPVRTLDLVAKFPELRFNADLSHWYTGLEMRYGDFEAKLDRLQPVFDRVRYMHLRMGHSCEMQVPLPQLRNHGAWQDYLALWKRSMTGFLASAQKSEQLIVAPELLPARVLHQGREFALNYARLRDPSDPYSEYSDRWTEALELKAIVENIWQNCLKIQEQVTK